MAYEFKTLGSVEALTEVPENANALVEVDGEIKRVPGGALGNKKEDANSEEKWDVKFVFDNNYESNGFLWDGLTSLESESLIMEVDNKEDIFEKVSHGVPIKVCLVGGEGYEGRVYTPVSIYCIAGSGNPHLYFNFMDMHYDELVATNIACAVHYDNIDVTTYCYNPVGPS
jgi:hypothetical protein